MLYSVDLVEILFNKMSGKLRVGKFLQFYFLFERI
ncbi:hypothetical protein SMU40_08551 [Streptococcus mutans 15VF2]|nr:hypothetical protein SMU88_00725 [Streptococcus mutans NLML8]EMB71003.1 hypothetical protein SMU33_03096 [Streptococcus mutans 11SSST2]EMB72272.1 hypothetical protein SMU40_08551 [Streptococcus mutans 15VF2]EMB96641.1 hypothetical protein SMU61_01977 [Streptococcus mutans G123]EMC05479.1 hypothetical protein SMU69_05495 [Streptococcus mutans NLML4]EMC40383.1 hypothetical protein SMU94_01020 [Streptococcus mutans 66-2A]EMC40903.1 hypothetical protein SMU95_01539 [Streptococcus mutans B]